MVTMGNLWEVTAGLLRTHLQPPITTPSLQTGSCNLWSKLVLQIVAKLHAAELFCFKTLLSRHRTCCSCTAPHHGAGSETRGLPASDLVDDVYMYIVTMVRRSQGKWRKWISEMSGNFRSTTLQKSKSIFKIIKKTYTFIVIKLIVHIWYSVHVIHKPLRSKLFDTNHYAVYFTV